jgi:hypothetical protein
MSSPRFHFFKGTLAGLFCEWVSPESLICLNFIPSNSFDNSQRYSQLYCMLITGVNYSGNILFADAVDTRDTVVLHVAVPSSADDKYVKKKL